LGSASSPPAQGSRGKMVFSDTLLFLPPLPCPSGQKRLSYFLQFTTTYVQAATCVLWSALYLLPSLSLPCFFPSLRYVSQQRPFVASVRLSAHHSPPAAHNFCVPFGLLRLRVYHTFCKEKSSKKICQTLASTVLPHALRAFGSPPLQAHAPSSVSNSIGFIPARFAFGGQVCHLGSSAFFGSRLFYLRQKKERGCGIVFCFTPLRVEEFPFGGSVIKKKRKKAAKLGGRSTCLLKNKTVRHNSF